MMGTNTTNAANGALFKKLSYDIDKDFAPIMRCVMGVNALVVNNDLPVKTTAELVDYAKKNPGKLNYAEASASQRCRARCSTSSPARRSSGFRTRQARRRWATWPRARSR